MIDVWLEGIEVAPVACLVDSGALRTRLPVELAALGGIELSGAPTEPFAVAGLQTRGAMARVTMALRQGGDAHHWEAPVWFCDPWPFAFGLLGLDGFLRHFRTTISAYEEWVECRPE